MNKMKNIKTSITTEEYHRLKALGMLGLIGTDIDPRVTNERLTFINNIDAIKKNLLRAYNIWYVGDSNELLNFHSEANAIDYNSNPFYNRNMRNYFWCVSSTEGNIKRTHSGMPRNITDTLVNIIGLPAYGVGAKDGALQTVSDRLVKICDDNQFKKILLQKARPLTLVEGWGAWKINWDSSFRDTPILLYYRADAVDFVCSNGQVIGIIYKDFYQDAKKDTYILFETRRLEKRVCEQEHAKKGQEAVCLVIEKELFKMTSNSDIITPCSLASLPQLKDVKPCIIIENFSGFLGVPSIYFDDVTGDLPGRSIFTGKLDMFDDLDQCYSQASNTVRRSTVHEYFDTQYLEKDPNTGMPIMPKSFDRSYVMFKGTKNGDGSSTTSTPVQVVQPGVNFSQYSDEERNILLNIISGLMSPATLGIDVAKKDNAEAQREKEKVTIFTRNTIIAEETRILKTLLNELLCADELMRTGSLTTTHYDVYLKYSELASNSYENRLETVLAAWQAGFMSTELAVEMLHGDSLSEEMKKKEIEYIKAKEEREMGQFGSGLNPNDMGDFGELGAENDYNEEHEHPSVSKVKKKLGIPELE